MALTADDQARLTALRAKLDKINSGEVVTAVSAAGRSATLAPPNAKAIADEIADLQARASGQRRRGAVRFTV